MKCVGLTPYLPRMTFFCHRGLGSVFGYNHRGGLRRVCHAHHPLTRSMKNGVHGTPYKEKTDEGQRDDT